MKAYLLRCKANIGTYMCMYTVKPLPFANPQFSNLPPTICLQFLSTSSILFLLTFFLLLRSASILICLLFMKKIVSRISVDFRPTFCRPKNWRSPKKLNFFFQISKLVFLCRFDAIKKHINNVRNSLGCHKQISILFLSLQL